MTDGLTAKIVDLHRHLADAGLSHAFGGALALAFCTAEPRATKDIDVNVFLAPGQLDVLLAALPAGIEVTKDARRQLTVDGQARLWWDATPVDVFLSNHSFHDEAERHIGAVAFAGVDALPVLACSDLAVFKAFFARPKDAVDVAMMAACGAVELDSLREVVADLLGSHEDRKDFFARAADMLRELKIAED